MSTTTATPGPYSGTSIPATTPAARPPGLAEAFTDAQLQSALNAAMDENHARLVGIAKEGQKRATFADFGRAFLAALPRLDHCVEADQKAEAWTLPTPPAGRRWHREDWKPEWLEGGYRPLLLREPILEGDEVQSFGEGPWTKACADSKGASGYYYRLRTRLPPARQGGGPAMSIDQLIVEAKHLHTAATGKEPSRVYLGLKEAAAFKAWTASTFTRHNARSDLEYLCKPPVVCGMTVYYVTEPSHLFVA